MDRVEATYKKDGMEITDILQPYSEEEVQENRIAKNNAKLLYSPEFIPFYADIKRCFKLSFLETIIYGFIRFYIIKAENSRFYFTNEQLSVVTAADVTDVQISNAMRNLQKKKLLVCQYKIKAGGGKIRFAKKVRVIEDFKYDLKESLSMTKRKLEGNKNKIKENKINKNKINIYMSDKKKKKKTENPDIQRIYEHYKEKIAPRARLTSDSKRKIVTRLKEFSAEDIEKAIDNFSRDSWWMENCGWRGIKWFFHSEDRLIQFLEMKPRQKCEYPNLTAEEEKAIDEKYAEFD